MVQIALYSGFFLYDGGMGKRGRICKLKCNCFFVYEGEENQ